MLIYKSKLFYIKTKIIHSFITIINSFLAKSLNYIPYKTNMNPSSSLFTFKDSQYFSKPTKSPLSYPHNFIFPGSKSQKKASAASLDITPDKISGHDQSKTSQKQQGRFSSNSPPVFKPVPNPKNQVQFPLPVNLFLATFSSSLSASEQKELADHEEIYYFNDKIQYSLTENIYDNTEGDYIIRLHDHLAYRYEIIQVLGKGTFGQVVKCLDHKRKEEVAVKIIKNKKRFYTQALNELKILQKLRQNDRENTYNVVRIKNYFMFRKHVCITFELLSLNLYELIVQNNFEGLNLILIHRFAVQILVCLQYIKKYGIVHCDLKPENILLRSTNKPMISVIDFGSASYENDIKGFYIQSRYYRAPEVILGCKYDYSIDMWSFGCILVELFTGMPIFPGESEFHQLLKIIEVIGKPPVEVLKKSSKCEQFFDSNMEPRKFVNKKSEIYVPVQRSLNEILNCPSSLFVDFVARCLTWEPETRLKPLEGLEHPWIAEGLKKKSA